MATIFNMEALVSVTVKGRKKEIDLKFKPFKKSFWGNTKEGFYDVFSMCDDYCYTAEELVSGKYYDTKLIVENNVAYYRPYVRLNFMAGQTYIQEFDTYCEALAWGQEQANKGMKVKLMVY